MHSWVYAVDEILLFNNLINLTKSPNIFYKIPITLGNNWFKTELLIENY